MPEGHSVHRLARQFTDVFGGRPIRATSPQGRFAEGAALLDGQRLQRHERNVLASARQPGVATAMKSRGCSAKYFSRASCCQARSLGAVPHAARSG